MGDPEVRVSTLRKFLGDEDAYFVLVFPETYGQPGKLPILMPDAAGAFPGIDPDGAASVWWRTLGFQNNAGDYHLYSLEETIQRARSRLGERKYDLALNNCEHFALWCKTGMHQSH